MSNIFHTETPEIKPGGEMPDGRTTYEYVLDKVSQKIHKRTIESYDAHIHPEDPYKKIVVGSVEVALKDLPVEIRTKAEAILNPKTELPAIIQNPDEIVEKPLAL